MRELTARQRQVFDAIVGYRAERGYLPSIRELRRMLGVSSLRGVTIHLDALERKGWIERERTSRSIRILAPEPSAGRFRSVPLLGTIAAGAPLLAVENVEAYVPLPDDMLARAGELFALKVRGDSMLGDHILDGDLVIVERRPTGRDGEIVAALIGDEATVKRLDMRSKPPRLLPSNPAYEPIELTKDDSRTLGRVVGLLRFRREP
jgi:repressor LexA